MKKIKTILLIIIYSILSLGATYLLYRLLRLEYEGLKDFKIHGFQDFMAFLLKIVIDLTNIFNIIVYMIFGCLWSVTYKKILEMNEAWKHDVPRDRDYYSELKNDVTPKKDGLDVVDYSLDNGCNYLC